MSTDQLFTTKLIPRLRSYVPGMSESVSPALLAANQQLHQRRMSERVRYAREYGPEARPFTHDDPSDRADGAETAVLPLLDNLPAHLGWGSAAVTAVLRTQPPQACTEPLPPAISQPEPPATVSPVATGETRAETAVSAATVRLYPDLALAMLRRNVVASGRLWLLLRTIDRAGEGSLRIAIVKSLTTKNNSRFLCGQRQLRNLLRQGEGLFWQRDGERLWLRSAAKVAARLGVARLATRAVDIPLSVLLAGVGEVKAHFYASFHSGRQQAPISRETLTAVTGVPARTQLRYEAQAGVGKRHNLAVGERLTAARMEERAWARGTAVFTFTDYLGRQGPARQQYIAWHLPNSYSGPHAPGQRGRMRKINRELKDLVKIQARGNSSDQVFFADGACAARAHGRRASLDSYWPQQGLAGRRGLWYCV